MTRLASTAWNLIGYDGTRGSVSDEDLAARMPERSQVRIAGGRALWEQVDYNDSTPGSRVRLGRLDVGSAGLHPVVRYVHPDTVLEIVPDAEAGR